METQIKNRIKELEEQQSRIIKDYGSVSQGENSYVLAERNTCISLELKFLNKLLSSQEVKPDELKTADRSTLNELAKRHISNVGLGSGTNITTHGLKCCMVDFAIEVLASQLQPKQEPDGWVVGADFYRKDSLSITENMKENPVWYRPPVSAVKVQEGISEQIKELLYRLVKKHHGGSDLITLYNNTVKDICALFHNKQEVTEQKTAEEIKQMFVGDMEKLRWNECSVDDVFNSLKPYLQSPVSCITDEEIKELLETHIFSVGQYADDFISALRSKLSKGEEKC